MDGILEDLRHSDHDLMERFRAGDREAFTAIYQARHLAVFRFALHMTADKIKAEEITQDVFVWLIQHPHDFDPNRGDLGAFLGGVARNMLRRQQRWDRRWLPLHDGLREIPLTDGRLDTAELKNAIARLPMRYREAIALCDLDNKTYEDAAALLGCAIGTIRSRLYRARTLLARKLRPKAMSVTRRGQ